MGASRESQLGQMEGGPELFGILLLGSRLAGTVTARAAIRPMLGVPSGDSEALDGRRRTTAGAVCISVPRSANMRSKPRELLP
jgi:hypothetical protein